MEQISVGIAGTGSAVINIAALDGVVLPDLGGIVFRRRALASALDVVDIEVMTLSHCCHGNECSHENGHSQENTYQFLHDCLPSLFFIAESAIIQKPLQNGTSLLMCASRRVLQGFCLSIAKQAQHLHQRHRLPSIWTSSNGSDILSPTIEDDG